MRDAALAAVAAKTKPPGSLGRLEELAVDLAVLQGTLRPSVDPARLVVFGADHGVAAEGVSAYPSEVTAQMMANLAAGGAAACVLTRAAGMSLEVVDDSHLHAGHAGAREGRHFTVRVVSERFNGLSRLARHRLVYDSLGDLMAHGIHALAIEARAPGDN